MTCAFPRETLALHIEGDLPEPQGNKLRLHLGECLECQQFYSRLKQSQTLLKSLRRQPVTPDAFSNVRRNVLSRIDSRQETPGWALKLERFVFLRFRRPRYAMAGFAFLAILSLSLLGQIERTPLEVETQAAVFDDRDALLRPVNYREWVLVGNSIGLQGHELLHRVYIDPSAYEKFAATGQFPEGTVLILETASGRVKNEWELLASVKDSRRFDAGWEYFNFTDSDGKLKASALAVPEETGCRSCHETRAETDHVFTQFYPILRSTGARS